jgi:hypothetical protein
VKIWRLLKGYLTSAQKQRERARRQHDFDLSLYVPFMKKLKDVEYAPDWVAENEMRVGYPTYNGPAIWHTWHVMAQRFNDIQSKECMSHDFNTKVVEKFKAMLAFFALSAQPCPACREHFLSQVSINDQGWKDEIIAPNSQARAYPLEWLYMSGKEVDWLSPEAGTLISKLEYMNPKQPSTVMLFFWKLHNAVSSTVEYGFQCKTDETADLQFTCSETSCPRFSQAFPVMNRFEYVLARGPNAWDRTRAEFKEAAAALRKLDKFETRIQFWERQERLPALNSGAVETVLEAIRDLDDAMLESKVLEHQYSPGASIGSFDCAIPSNTPPTPKLPLEEFTGLFHTCKGKFQEWHDQPNPSCPAQDGHAELPTRKLLT